jgi:hypothetical protein
VYERLGEETLKTGERMEVGVITAPDAEWKDRIVPFLGHKQEPYASHIRRSHAGPLDDLETRYYIGHLAGRVISEVMIVGARGAGILGHVYTLPEQRRKGAYQAVMAAQMADMGRRGFRLLALGTGYDSAPYWIYHSHGFRGIGEGRGEMVWAAGPDSEAGLFRPASVRVRPLRWDDWGYFGWLGLLPLAGEEELPRSRALRLRARGIAEGPFVSLMLKTEETPGLIVRVLESELGATTAWAILSHDPHWLPDAWSLDLHAHPAFAAELPRLLAALPWPDAPVAAAFTEPSGPKAAALESAGFTRAARLPDWFRAEDGSRRPVGLWIRTQEP